MALCFRTTEGKKKEKMEKKSLFFPLLCHALPKTGLALSTYVRRRDVNVI